MCYSALARFNILVGPRIRVNVWRGNITELGNTHGRTGRGIKATGFTTDFMEKVNTMTRKANIGRENITTMKALELYQSLDPYR
mmetsp:Transcript_13475/g.18461  ORF Transcript_13475/g.18461 Transcript_13475/m.18461 type:complete len:84 (-) Transcript_13475:111-362(-)